MYPLSPNGVTIAISAYRLDPSCCLFAMNAVTILRCLFTGINALSGMFYMSMFPTAYVLRGAYVTPLNVVILAMSIPPNPRLFFNCFVASLLQVVCLNPNSSQVVSFLSLVSSHALLYLLLLYMIQADMIMAYSHDYCTNSSYLSKLSTL